MRILVLLLMVVISLWVQAAKLDDSLIKRPDIQQVSMSPDGSKIAVITIENGQRVAALMTREPAKVIDVLGFSGDDEVGAVFWVNNERILATVRSRQGWYDGPVSINQMYAMNYDGSKKKVIYGYRSDNKKLTRAKMSGKKHTAHADIISLLPDDREHILIRTKPWKLAGNVYRVSEDTFGEILKLNVYTGKLKRVMRSPVRGGVVYADDSGQVRFAMGGDEKGIIRSWFFHNKKWQLLDGSSMLGGDMYPLSYDSNGRHAYLVSGYGSDTKRLVRFDYETQTSEVLYENDRLDVNQVTIVDNIPVQIHLDDPMPVTVDLEPDNSVVKFLRGVRKAMGEYRVELLEVAKNKDIAVLRFSGDNLPGEFCFAELKRRAVGSCLPAAQWLEPEKLARTKAFRIKARDGQPLDVYLTLPPHKSPRQLPLIVHPHGGPMQRDYWDYDQEAQIFASAGYAVLNVNFRGSSGYGDKFLEAGSKNWGGIVQQDIMDAAGWAIEQGYADAERLCIYGASFGAYSAMMNAVLAPQMYRCAAGFAGVYDLEMMYRKGDIASHRIGRRYLQENLGKDEALLRRYSPVHRAAEIKVPVFIAHGGADRRAPIEHAKALESALRKAGVKVKTRYYKKGGHGYYLDKANRRLYRELLDFFDRHIGDERK